MRSRQKKKNLKKIKSRFRYVCIGDMVDNFIGSGTIFFCNTEKLKDIVYASGANDPYRWP